MFVSFDDGGRWQPLRMALPGAGPVVAPSPAPSARPPARTAATRPEGSLPAPAGTAPETPAGAPVETLTAASTHEGELPVVPITDLVVKGDDLVVATQGRSFWILDDLSPLRQMAPDVAGADAHLFRPRAGLTLPHAGGAPRHGTEPARGRRPLLLAARGAQGEGRDRARGAAIPGARSSAASRTRTRRRTRAGRPPMATTTMPRGATKLPAKAGLNRFVWDLRSPDATKFKGLILWAGGTRGPRIAPGAYTVRFTAAGKTVTEPLAVVGDPRLPATAEDYGKQYDLLLKIRNKLTETHDAVSRIREVRDQVKTVADHAKTAGSDDAIAKAAEALTKSVTSVEEALYQTKNQSSQDPLNFPIRLNNKLSALAGVVASADGAPTASSYAVYEDLAKRIDVELAKLKQILDTDLASFNQLVREKAVPAVVIKK